MSERWIPKWPIPGTSTSLVLVALIRWSDGKGFCWASRSQLADYANCCPETARKSVKQFIEGGYLSRNRSERQDDGQFAMNSYQLDLSNPEIADLFRGFRCDDCDEQELPSVPDPSRPHSGRGKKLPRPTHIERRPNAGLRPSIDSRAPASASSIFFPPSLPDEFVIEDEKLREKVELTLSVCGRGLDKVTTPGLLESLVECLPVALQQGYDFEKDILSCVRSKTASIRQTPLWSFRIIFRDDLPTWRENRLARILTGEARKTRKAMKGRMPSGQRSRSDELNRFLSQREFARAENGRTAEVARLENLAAILADRNPPDWALDDDRNLTGEARDRAIERRRTAIAAQLLAARDST